MKVEDGRRFATHFPVGDECVNPIIRKRENDKEARKDNEYYGLTDIPEKYKIHFYGLYATDIAYKEFAKEDYKEEIRKKAREKTLTIDDIFEAYSNARIVIYVFGNDSVTGARRNFRSPMYCRDDIVEGEFHSFYKMPDSFKKLSRSVGKKKIQLMKKMLSVIDHKTAK